MRWVLYTPEKRPQNETYFVHTLILDSSALRTEKNKCLLFKSLSLQHFVMAACPDEFKKDRLTPQAGISPCKLSGNSY